MRIVFAGTPEFAAKALEALVQHHDVCAVFTQPDRPAGRGKRMLPSAVKVSAQEHDLAVYQPAKIASQTEQIRALQPDVMVVVAYGGLIPQAILDIPRLGCLNIHASLLPRWRGAAPIQRAIEAGDATTGVSIMQMEAGLDTGPVYLTKERPISTTDTSASLHESLAALGAQGICETLELLSQTPPPTPQPQEEHLANYAHKLKKQEAIIDWSDSATQIQREIRAFNPWPISTTYSAGKRLRVWQAKVIAHNSSTQEPPGSVLSAGNDGVLVACGQDQLLLQVLQKDGSKALDAKTFLNGFSLKPESVLGPI